MINHYEYERWLCAPLEDVLTKLYTASFYRWLYADRGLRLLTENHPDITPWNEISRSNANKFPNKSYCINLLRTVFKNKAMLRQLLDALPRATRDAIEILTWESSIDLAILEARVGQKLAYKNPDTRQAYFHPYVLPDEHGFLSLVKKEDRWNYDPRSTKKSQVTVFIPTAVRKRFKTAVPPPKGYELIPLDDLPDTGHMTYSRAGEAITDMQLIAEFIAQGHLKRTQSNKISAISFKQIRGLIKDGPEFFEDSTDSYLSMLRARLLIDGVEVADGIARENLLRRESGAEPVREIHASISGNARFLHSTLLSHVYFYRYGACAPSPGAAEDLVRFFSRLPPGKWVAWENIQRYHILRDQAPSLFDDKVRIFTRVRQSDNSWLATVDVQNNNRFDLVSMPLLKGYAFLLAAFGLVDIAYVMPSNAKFQHLRRDYLTPFDGLRFVRLTPLGEFAYGRRETYEVPVGPPTSTPIILDDLRLLATCRNADTLTELAIGRFFEKLTPGRYRMTPKSMLGDCSTREEIEERIRLFRRVVSPKPPPIWEQFFSKILSSLSPFELEPDYLVLKVSDDEDLRRLLVEDPILRKITLKVEGRRIAVRRQHYGTLTKLLAQHGYISPR